MSLFRFIYGNKMIFNFFDQLFGWTGNKQRWSTAKIYSNKQNVKFFTVHQTLWPFLCRWAAFENVVGDFVRPRIDRNFDSCWLRLMIYICVEVATKRDPVKCHWNLKEMAIFSFLHRVSVLFCAHSSSVRQLKISNLFIWQMTVDDDYNVDGSSDP